MSPPWKILPRGAVEKSTTKTEDRCVSLDPVGAFSSTLERLGKDATIVVYPGADHAFANPSGHNYQTEAAENAWQTTLEFLREHLRK